MKYFQFDSNVAKKHIQGIQRSDEELAKVEKSIFSQTVAPFLDGRQCLEEVVIVEDFESSYDKAVTDFLETCIHTFALFVRIQHEQDGKAKIILA